MTVPNITQAAQLRPIAVAALKAAGTDAGLRVYAARDWPTRPDSYPVLLVLTPFEDAAPMSGRISNSGPWFETVATLRVIGRVEEPAKGDDAGAIVAIGALEDLEDQIKRALINNPAFGPIGFAFVRSRNSISPDGREHLGAVVVDIGIAYAQGPEDFFLNNPGAFDGVDIHLDTAAPFSPTGTFADPAFPAAVVPAPRTTGPDGRDEAALKLDLPQD